MERPGAARPYREKSLPAGFAPLTAAAAATTTAGSARKAATSTATTFGLGTRFVHIQRATIEVSAVQCRDCLIRLSGIAHFDESEPA